MGALSLTGSKPQQKRRFSPLVPGVTHVRYPYTYRGCTGGQQEEEAFSMGCARYIEEKLFKSILPPEEVAAIFIEPIQGEGGFIVAPDNFLRELRAICTRHGILLVVDEVQCVCMTRAEVMDWVPGSHASTFGGNPVSIAAALATMDIIEREAMANAAKVGEFMLERVRGWKQSHPLVGDVRGRGLMIGIELVKDKATREPAVALRNRVETLAFERGLMVLGCGETSLRLSPPLIVNEHEATVALDILEEALTLVEKEHAQAGALEAATA
jgi:4-aminobutyrate aminotransferase